MPSVNQFPKVSILVVNYNGLTALGDLLQRCLYSALSIDYPDFELIFVDNASDDDSMGYVEKSLRDNRVKLLRLNTNRFYLGALEEGAKVADERSEYLVFMNNDVVVTPSWLKQLITVMVGDQSVGIACPSVLNFDGSPQWTAGYVDRFINSIYLADLSMKKTFLASVPNGPVYVIRRSLVRDKSFFDRVLVYNEEEYVGHIVWMKGFKIVVVPTSVVYHRGRATIGKYNISFFRFHLYKNEFYLLFKFGDTLSIVVGFLLKLARLPIFAVAWAAARGKGDFIIYLHAISWLFRNSRKIRRCKGKGMLYMPSKYSPLLSILRYTRMGKRILRIVARHMEKEIGTGETLLYRHAQPLS